MEGGEGELTHFFLGQRRSGDGWQNSHCGALADEFSGLGEAGAT